MAQNDENTSGSCTPSEGNHFLYFSYLFENDDDNDAHGACKRVKRELKEFSKLPPPFGLRLTITPSLLQLRKENLNGADVARTPCQESPNKVEKLKAVHLPLCYLMIGFYKVEARYAADLVAKFYFARRKLVWEILDEGLRRKVEIEWKNISAIRASIEENKPRNVEIELDRVPSFFQEHTPQPRKRTIWFASSDFTKGCASKYRRHLLRFPAGVLDQHYLKLLQLDKRLLKLSRAPFPSSESVYFNANSNEGTTRIPFGSRTTPASEQPIVDPPLPSTQQVNQYGNAMRMPFNAINDQPAFDLPPVSTQQFQLHDNMMTMLIGAINNPASLSLPCDQQLTFDLISAQQLQLHDNTLPLSLKGINDPTSPSSACEQFAFDLPVGSTQQVKPYENTMPLSTSATINESAPLPSGICYPKNETINNQLFQDPRLAACNPGPDVQRCSFYQEPGTFPHNNGSMFMDPST